MGNIKSDFGCAFDYGMKKSGFTNLKLSTIKRNYGIGRDIDTSDLEPLRPCDALGGKHGGVVDAKDFVYDTIEYGLRCAATVGACREGAVYFRAKEFLVLWVEGEVEEEEG